MKALTNILTRLLMLMLLMLVACTEEAAEVDNLTRGEQYVTVRMNIPGMTATATRADDGVIESITALAFDDADKLLEIETITTVNNINENGGFNGTFNLTVPNGTTTIHFLANLPNDAKSQLPTEMGGSEVDVMTSFTTDDFNNLCYWGMTTTWDGNTNPLNVTLYRNLAKISIKPSITDTEFNQFEEEDLIIAGLINPNRVGKLVPYNNSFPQSIGELIYNTLPDNPNPLNRTPIGNEGAGYGNWLYVLEHENSNYEEYGLFVICKIGDYFYNVALTSDGVNPYPIIRNHEYIIYVSDVDDYQSEEYRSMNYSDMYDTNTSKILKTPINLEVKQKENVSLTLTSTANTLYYGDSSEEAVTVTVSGIVEGVESLTLTAPGFTIETDYATLENGKYVLDDEITQIDFTLKLTDPENAGNIGVEGFTSDELVEINGAETEIELIENQETNVWWQGAVKLHTPEDGEKHAAKIQMPYSNLFDENGNRIPDLGSVVKIDYTTNDPNWIAVQIPTDGDWINLGSNRDGSILITLDEDAFSQIEDYDRNMWDDNMRTAFIIQGNGYTLKKVSLLPTKGAITATPSTEELYYNGEKSFTITATVPAGVSTLYIAADDFTVTQNGQSLNLNDNVYTYNIGDTSKQNEIQFVFTLKNEVQSAKESTTIKFSADYMNSAKVTVTVAEKRNVEFAQSSNQIYINGNNKSNLNVTMTVPQNGTVTALSISAPGFTIKQGETPLGDGNYTGSELNIAANSSVVYTFVPNTFGKGKQITFTASGTNLQETTRTLNVDVLASIFASATVDNPTLYYDQDNQTVTVNVTMPIGLSAINIGGAGNFTITKNAAGTFENNVYTRASATTEETIPFVFTLDKSKYTSQKGDTSVTFTFSDESTANQNDKATQASVPVNLIPTPEVTFSQSAETIYRDGEPLTVTMTVPNDGSVTLSIGATGFTVTKDGNELSKNNEGKYTYTGGSTTFTFVPTAVGIDKPITFTGSGTNLKDIDETIIVTVKETKPAVTETIFWYEASGKALSWSNWEIKGTINSGDIVKIYVSSGNNPIFKIYGGNWGNIGDKIVWDQDTVTVTGTGDGVEVSIGNNTEILSFKVTEELYNNSTISQGLILQGTDITVNKITLIR